MKFGEHNLGCRNSLFLMHVNGNPSAVVIHHDAVISPDANIDGIAVTRSCFVDTVVYHLIY